MRWIALISNFRTLTSNRKKKLKIFLFAETFVVQAGIEYDPCDQKTCKRSHETFFQ